MQSDGNLVVYDGWMLPPVKSKPVAALPTRDAVAGRRRRLHHLHDCQHGGVADRPRQRRLRAAAERRQPRRVLRHERRALEHRRPAGAPGACRHPAPAPAPAGTLPAGGRLDAGQSWSRPAARTGCPCSPTGTCVVYKTGGASAWASRTSSTARTSDADRRERGALRERPRHLEHPDRWRCPCRGWYAERRQPRRLLGGEQGALGQWRAQAAHVTAGQPGQHEELHRLHHLAGRPRTG